MPATYTHDLNANLNKVTKIVFPVYGIVSCIVYSVDLIYFYQTFPRLLYINLASICCTLVTFSLYYFKLIKLKTGFGFIIYISFASIISDTLFDPFALERIFFFLRDSMFVFLIITLAALFISKYHSISIASIHVLITIVLSLVSGNSLLSSSVVMIAFTFIAYTGVMYYAVSVFENSIREREKNLRTIEEDNAVINETNALLEERQQQIEKQSEELSGQTEVLIFQSKELQESNLELERLNKTKDLFLSILAHDLRNSFHLITNYAEMMVTRHESMDPTIRFKFINIINTTSKKAFKLLEQLLQWAQSQSNTIDYKPTNLAIDHLISETLFLYVESYQNKGIQVIQNLDPGCNVYVDENMLNTVIRNLLSNAIKFTPYGGKIDVNCSKSGDRILIEVADSGIGIKETDLEELFKIEKTRSTAGTSGETGSGLGLLLCKEFVEKNGGKMVVTSEVNSGSVFSFSLPAV